MADVRQRTTLGNLFRFLVRVLGLTGLVAAAGGAVLLSTAPTDLPGWAAPASHSPAEWATAAGNWAPDAGDFAAERKVVEKVRDLVDQLRELGPRFKVTVLDVEEEGYEDRLAALTRDAPELRAAIDAAPENSIFFHAAGRVQRMSFGEF